MAPDRGGGVRQHLALGAGRTRGCWRRGATIDKFMGRCHVWPVLSRDPPRASYRPQRTHARRPERRCTAGGRSRRAGGRRGPMRRWPRRGLPQVALGVGIKHRPRPRVGLNGLRSDRLSIHRHRRTAWRSPRGSEGLTGSTGVPELRWRHDGGFAARGVARRAKLESDRGQGLRAAGPAGHLLGFLAPAG